MRGSVPGGRMHADWVRFLMVSLDVEKIPRFYRGKKKERSDKRYGEPDVSRKTLKKEEPHVK